MKGFIICSSLLLVIGVVSSANLRKRQTNSNNIQNLENLQNLLQELEKANVNINEISSNANKNINTGGKETPVRDALSRLFGAFQQMASAYVGVLTSVGKSIGIPTIGAQYLQSPSDPPIVIKQIGENLRQFQDSVQEVSKSINNFFTRGGPQDNNVLANEMRKFLRLWSNQIQEVSDQVTRTFGGLQSYTPDSSYVTIPIPFLDFFQNLMRVMEETFTDITQRMTRLVTGQQPSGGNGVAFLEDPKQSQMDILKEFKNLVETIQKRMKALSQQLDSLMTNNPSGGQKAEHRDH